MSSAIDVQEVPSVAQQVCQGIVLDWIQDIEEFETLQQAVELELQNPHNNDNEKDAQIKLPKTTRSIVRFVKQLNHDDHEIHSSIDQIFQLKVVRQRTSSACGYHAYHNALLLVRALFAKSAKSQIHLLTELKENTSSFWFSYHRLHKMLLKRVNEILSKNSDESFFPWTLEDVNSGCMERSFMNYVIANDPLPRVLFRTFFRKTLF